MKNMIFCLFIIIFSNLNTHAVELAYDDSYVYQIRNYKQIFFEDRLTKVLIKRTFIITKNLLRDLKDQGLILMDHEFETLADLDRIEKGDLKIASGIKKLNSHVQKKKQDAPVWLTGDDLVPDAIIINTGAKLSFNMKFGGGANANLGVIVVPIYITKIDKFTGRIVDEYFSIRANIFLIGGPDLGGGIGAGIRKRVGFGFVWDLTNNLTNPEQFSGFGAALSKSYIFGIGANIKIGLVKNLSQGGLANFMFAMFNYEKGLAATNEAHLNVLGILNATKLVSIFSKEGSSLIAQFETELADRISSSIVKKIKEQKNNQDDDSDSEDKEPSPENEDNNLTDEDPFA